MNVLTDALFLVLASWILFAMFVGDIGKRRNIGYTNSFWLSILLSPPIALVITLTSPKLGEQTVKSVMQDLPKAEDSKTCPDCAEEVKSAAKKCKHCGFRWDS